MKRLLRSITGGFDPHDILELNLDAERLAQMLEAPLTSLDLLQDFRRLEHLNATGHALATTHGIEALPALQTLDLSHNQLQALPGLCHLVHLADLDLSYNHLTTTAGLHQLPRLRLLNLSHNRLDQIDELHELVSLEILTLSANKALTQIDALVGLPNLHTLYLKQLRVKSLQPLATLPALRTLYLTLDEAEMLAPLAHAPLRELHLGGRDLPSLEGLPPLPHLESLTVSGCLQLRDVGALSRYPTLRHLHLPFNNLTQLDVVHALPLLETLDVRGNPIVANLQQAVARFGHVPLVRYE